MIIMDFTRPIAIVPLIVHCPALIHEGQRLGGLVRLTDIAPTILDYSGLTAVAER